MEDSTFYIIFGYFSFLPWIREWI